MAQHQQQLRSLADDYGLKLGSPPHSPPPPQPTASLQIISSGVAEEQKQEAVQEDVKNKSGEGTSEEVKLTLGDDSESKNVEEEQADSNGGEEEEECGFCLFMKGGGCKENFIAWEKCVEEAENNKEDIVEKCYEVTALLTKCMEAHADYYEPILRAEKAMKEEVAQQSKQDGDI